MIESHQREFTSPEDPNDPRSYYELGYGFQMSAEMAMRNSSSSDIPAIYAQRLLPPWITSNGFAVELYLKCLLVEEGVSYKDRHGHDLNMLFLKLKPETKAMLAQRYDEYIKRPAIKGVFDKSRAINPNIKLDFETVIKDCKDTFIDWRYIFENFNSKD